MCECLTMESNDDCKLHIIFDLLPNASNMEVATLDSHCNVFHFRMNLPSTHLAHQTLMTSVMMTIGQNAALGHVPYQQSSLKTASPIPHIWSSQLAQPQKSIVRPFQRPPMERKDGGFPCPN